MKLPPMPQSSTRVSLERVVLNSWVSSIASYHRSFRLLRHSEPDLTLALGRGGVGEAHPHHTQHRRRRRGGAVAAFGAESTASQPSAVLAVQNGATSVQRSARVSLSAGTSTARQGEQSKGDVASSWNGLVGPEVALEVTQRLQRLEVLMLLRRLYRDVARAERLVRFPIPQIAKVVEGTQELTGRRRQRKSVDSWMRRAWSSDALVIDAWSEVKDDADVASPEPFELESASEVLEFAGDIQEMADQLKNDMLRLQDRLPVVFPGDSEVVGKVRSTVEMLEAQLGDLARSVDASLTPEDRIAAAKEKQEELEMQDENVQARILRRLEGLTTTGQAVGERLAGVGQGLSQIDFSSADFSLQGAKQAGSSALQTLGGLWRRLNGQPAACDLEPLAAGLPRPQSTLGEQEEKKVALLLQVEALDKKLTEASKAREARLRQSSLGARTRLLATEIRTLDEEVNDVRKQLTVRALELEMQLIYIALESELLLPASSWDSASDEDEALLIAEFGLLDTDLAPLRAAVDRQEAILIDDDELDVLAVDIPDLKQRLGIVEAPTVPVNQRLQITFDETSVKLREGSSFVWRGLRLLSGDIGYSLKLFWVAVNGATLKAREVQTLRRTAKDILVIIPFTIILIAPITPVGHVLVFSFLQKYFPGFFPSSFSPRRQEVMQRYEVLKLELESGSASATIDKEQARAIAAAAAVETFEAREDEDEGQGNSKEGQQQQKQWFLPGFWQRKGGLGTGPGFSRPDRVLGDDPKKLRLLQEKLPGISSLLSDLKARDSTRLQQPAALLAPAGAEKAQLKNGSFSG